MSLSPLTLIASAGLAQNNGLGINATLTSNINSYKGIGVVNEFATVLTNIGSLSAPVQTSLKTFTKSTFPVVNNTVPNAFTGIVVDDESRFTDELIIHANNILGNGDLSKFSIHMSAVLGHMATTAEFIDSASTANSQMEFLYTGMDDMMSAGITSVTTATHDFGNDLISTGILINLSDLDNYGTVDYLIKKLNRKGLLNYLSDELISAGISVDGLINKIQTLDDNESLPLVIQKKCYEVFKTIKSTKLTTIKEILGVTSAEVLTVADLIDTHKLFLNSRLTLKAPYKEGPKVIYLDITGTVNNVFSGLGKEYYSIVPKSIADGNVAFRRSLKQVKNIQNQQTSEFGNFVIGIETNYGLDDINSIDKPIPDSVQSYFENSFGIGTDTNGKLFLSDGIGSPAGITHNDALSVIIETMTELTTQGAFDGLYQSTASTGVFTTMIDVLNDVYGAPPTIVIPGTHPASGSYATYDAAITALISAASTEISTISSTYPDDYSNLNTNFDKIGNQIDTELSVLAEINIDMSLTPSSKQSILSFSSNLPSYGKQTQAKGPAEILEKLADSTQTGQAIVATMREGRNTEKLQNLGISIDNKPELPAANNDAELSTSQYTASQSLTTVERS